MNEVYVIDSSSLNQRCGSSERTLFLTAIVGAIVPSSIQLKQSFVEFYSAFKNQYLNVTHTIESLVHFVDVIEILHHKSTNCTFLISDVTDQEHHRL